MSRKHNHLERSGKVVLGLNVDHVATLRQARRGTEPDVLEAALEGVRGGARGITAHLREDRRHIQDSDLTRLKRSISVPLNLEMSIAEEIVRIACRLRPEKVCLVPERREELTTEGGLDVILSKRRIRDVVKQLQAKKMAVSLFIDPIPKQIRAASEVGADFIELHTGTYARYFGRRQGHSELKRLAEAACLAHSLGLAVNAGHGLNYKNVQPIAQLPYMKELNIGHSIISRAVFVGVREAVRQMCRLIQKANSG